MKTTLRTNYEQACQAYAHALSTMWIIPESILREIKDKKFQGD